MSLHCPDLSILLPVDGSENSDRAVRLLVSLYAKLAPKEVRVLHVLVPAIPADDKLSRPEARRAEFVGRRKRCAAICAGVA